MPNIVPCPSCQRQLALPDEAAGKLVRCPQCNNTFTAPPAAGAVLSASPPPLPPATLPEEEESRSRPRRRFRDDDDDDFDDMVRRPGAPHRGAAILTLGILGLLFLGCGFILGPIAWVMGNNDLKEMAAGRMDRSGEGLTQAGRIIGMVATIISVVVVVLWCMWFVFVMSVIGAGGRGLK